MSACDDYPAKQIVGASHLPEEGVVGKVWLTNPDYDAAMGELDAHRANAAEWLTIADLHRHFLEVFESFRATQIANVRRALQLLDQALGAIDTPEPAAFVERLSSDPHS